MPQRRSDPRRARSRRRLLVTLLYDTWVKGMCIVRGHVWVPVWGRRWYRYCSRCRVHRPINQQPPV